jgi:F0F1-type ATP synthase delta subunit
MNKNKQKQLAKSLFKKSTTNEVVDGSKVKKLLSYLDKEKPANLKNILKIYKNLIASALLKEETIVETASPITNQKSFEKKIKARTGAHKITFKINPQMVIGAKIKHGDWVWEETLDSKLKQLTINNQQ